MKAINKKNFFECTTSNFIRVTSRPNRTPDYISYKNSHIDYIDFITDNNVTQIDLSFDDFKIIPNEYKKISSVYWYTDKGVYRQSDHWGNISSCYWSLNEELDIINIGYCNWDDFNKEDKEVFTHSIFDNESVLFKPFNVYFHKKEGYRVINYFGSEDQFTKEEFLFFLQMCIETYEQKFLVKIKLNQKENIINNYKQYIKL